MKRRLRRVFLRLASGDVNPVAVKEIRQAVRSRFVLWVLVLLLACLFVVTAGFMVSTGVSRAMDPSAGRSAGRQLFATIVTMLGVACLLVPVYSAARLTRERTPPGIDLLFTTTLTPGAIVRGKFAAGIALVVLLASASAPFMALTYLFRGIELTTIVWGIVLLLAASAKALLAGIVFGSLPLPKPARQSLGVLMVIALVQAVPILIFSMGLSGTGPLVALAALGFPAVLLLAAGSLSGLLLLYALAVLLLSPPRSNRFFPFRLTVSAVWLFDMLVMAAGYTAVKAPWLLTVATVPWVALGCLSLQIAACEGEGRSARVLRDVPPKPLLRVPAFLLFNGSAGGILWSLAILALTLAAAPMIVVLDPSVIPGSFDLLADFCAPLAVTVLYLACYILTAAAIYRPLPGRSFAWAPWLITIYLLALGSLFPAVIHELHHQGHIAWAMNVEFGNPLSMFKRSQAQLADAHALFAGVWFFLVVLLNVSPLLRSVAAFRPTPRPAPGPTAPPAAAG